MYRDGGSRDRSESVSRGGGEEGKMGGIECVCN